jgi:hypothetical protein
MSSFWLEKELCAGGRAGADALLAGAEKLRALRKPHSPPLRRITFIMNTAAAGISICPRRNSCKAATTGARG